jgi:hypothetical protein
MARSHTMQVKAAVASKNWALAEQIVLDDMRGTHARNWLRRIERLKKEAHEEGLPA